MKKSNGIAYLVLTTLFFAVNSSAEISSQFRAYYECGLKNGNKITIFLNGVNSSAVYSGRDSKKLLFAKGGYLTQQPGDEASGVGGFTGGWGYGVLVDTRVPQITTYDFNDSTKLIDYACVELK